jgi:hypothetical protein
MTLRSSFLVSLIGRGRFASALCTNGQLLPRLASWVCHDLSR